MLRKSITRIRPPTLPQHTRPHPFRTRRRPTADDATGDWTVPSGREDATETASLRRGNYEGDTAYQIYLREIGQVKLLTPGEEIVLAKRIKKGDQQAREQMIKANLRLVVKIARDYEGYGLPLLDLINEGNIGLIKGVTRFDPNRGAKLSTYAAWWIKQSIKRALANQSKTIRLPVHVVDRLSHIRRAEAKLYDLIGHEPTDEEIAAELHLDVKRVHNYRTISARPTSLDAPLGEDETDRIGDVIKDENAETPYEILEGKSNNALIDEIFGSLEPREQAVLRQRFGLQGKDHQTLEEVGNKFGVTRERIRQIQEIALQKLRRKIEKLEKSCLAA